MNGISPKQLRKRAAALREQGAENISEAERLEALAGQAQQLNEALTAHSKVEKLIAEKSDETKD